MANIVQFGFIVQHTNTLFSHNPQPQSFVAFDSISVILVDIKVLRKAKPLKGTVKLCRAPKVWSKGEGVAIQKWEPVDSQVIITRFAVNSELIVTF